MEKELFKMMRGDGAPKQGDVAANWLRAAVLPWNLLRSVMDGTDSPVESLFSALGVEMPQATKPVP